MWWCSTEWRTRKYVKRYRSWSFGRKYKKQQLDAELDASKKEFHKTGEYLGKKIADTVLSNVLPMQTNSTDDKFEQQEPVEEIIILPEKKRINIKQTERSKWNTINYLNY